jgi:hypothetical protein
MSRATYVALALAPLLAAAVAPSSERFKEVACVRITAPPGAQPQRFIVIVKGDQLRVSRSNCALPLGGASIIRDTLTAPATLAILGVGETELVAVDSSVKYTARLEALLDGSTEAKTITASHIVISHPKMQDPFSIRAFDAGNR